MVRRKLQRLRIGVVGQGPQAQRYNKALGGQLAETVNLTQVVRDTFSQKNWAENLKNVFSSLRLDGIVIASIPEVQVKILRVIYGNELPLILEKPLACSKKTLLEIQSVEGGRENVLVNHPHLFDVNVNTNAIPTCPNFLNINFSDIKKLIVVEGGIGPFRKNISPFFDWGAHAAVVCLQIFDDMPYASSCEKMKTTNCGEVWKLDLKFSNERSATLVFGNGLEKKTRLVEGYNSQQQKILNWALPDNLWEDGGPCSTLVANFLDLARQRTNPNHNLGPSNIMSRSSSFELSVQALQVLIQHSPTSS